jgi:putative hydrolase of the HAD superfamily
VRKILDSTLRLAGAPVHRPQWRGKNHDSALNSFGTPGQCVIFVDADNTLWDTNQVYADAQLALLTDVESASALNLEADDRLAWLRQIDQALAERHHAGLRYPPRLLAKATALALKGEHIPVAVRLAWSGGKEGFQTDEDTARQIESRFLDRLKELPSLREGVAQGLKVLHEAGCRIIVLTEGGRNKVLSLLAHYQLASMVTRVIEARKQRRLFERVVAALPTRSLKAFMIGDQLDRDIAPAKAAGLTTIFFPGGFQPKWQPAEADIQPDFTIQNFNQAAAIILGNIAR